MHPQVTVRTDHLPCWRVLEAVPRFSWRGLHLRTQHPIELTEPLLILLFPRESGGYKRI
ncbi:MAG: hypothetical protein KatS3mg025_1933 [Bacteroidia bacterium]|nr:MAG: hypothetical protein KatS3mg025_1933 [Bacteroidia bacterium]